MSVPEVTLSSSPELFPPVYVSQGKQATIRERRLRRRDERGRYNPEQLP